MSLSRVSSKARTPFERIGGREPIARLVDRFYDLMDSESDFAALRAMHLGDLAHMRASLTDFLVAWMGGPRDWFDKNPGACIMSAHGAMGGMGQETADQWMACMTRAARDSVPMILSSWHPCSAQWPAWAAPWRGGPRKRPLPPPQQPWNNRQMLQRLLFILFLAGLALPAMQAQACESPAAMAHNMPMHHAPAQPAPAPTADHHDCIGCIAPLAIALYRPVSAPEFMAARHDAIRNSSDHARDTAAPEPPPPRATV